LNHTTPPSPSRSAAVKSYLRHYRQFGDARSVYETAGESFSATELGYLATQLRQAKPIKENAHYLVNAGQRNERRQDWPAFKLTPDERDRLARRLIGDGVEHKTAAAYLGTTRAFVDRLATDVESDIEAEQRCKELLAIHGPVDVMDSSLDPVVRRAFLDILGIPPHCSETECTTTTNTGDAKRDVSVGDRFGRLVVIGLSKDANYLVHAEVRCDCGTVKTVRVGNLTQGKVQSCGCLLREQHEAAKARSRVG
jgi:hypothetical protein